MLDSAVMCMHAKQLHAGRTNVVQLLGAEPFACLFVSSASMAATAASHKFSAFPGCNTGFTPSASSTARCIQLFPSLSRVQALLRCLCCRHQCIPFPGEVDFICGGPPCQGISGNNRHAAREDILNDPRCGLCSCCLCCCRLS